MQETPKKHKHYLVVSKEDIFEARAVKWKLAQVVVELEGVGASVIRLFGANPTQLELGRAKLRLDEAVEEVRDGLEYIQTVGRRWGAETEQTPTVLVRFSPPRS